MELHCNLEMDKKLTLGSLFDGSGGFPLAALQLGIEPIWASEIAPFPIRVTTKRIPSMKHYGDITKLSGKDLPPVDIITFGSPCTDMSFAGRRTGINGKQSILFFDAIRIIKEMREATNGVYPRFIVWENVLGAISSNKGEDFKQAIKEIIGLKENVLLPSNFKFGNADTIVGNGYSIAYRVIDAQYFGVPQQRKRLFLVADFGSECAYKTLFEPKGVSRDYSSNETSGNNFTSATAKYVKQLYQDVYCIAESIIGRKDKNGGLGCGFKKNISFTLIAFSTHAVCYNVSNNSIVRRFTPTEYARLQGFPDNWCQDLETPNPSKEEIDFFKQFVSEKRVISWLKHPYSEYKEYKMWGNGVALPCIRFVLKGIANMYKI